MIHVCTGLPGTGTDLGAHLKQTTGSHPLALLPGASLRSSLCRQGTRGGGPFCDHPSGPQQYFLTKLQTEIQFLGSWPAEIHVFVNFAQREVCTLSLLRHYCNSTLGYRRQVMMPTKKKNSPPADHRRLPTMAFGRWISTKQNRLKKSLNVII
jgi:hypothetical protein